MGTEEYSILYYFLLSILHPSPFPPHSRPPSRFSPLPAAFIQFKSLMMTNIQLIIRQFCPTP